MLTFHSFRALGSTYSRLHHRLPKKINADAISSLQFLKNLPSVHVLGIFNFKDIDWPDILNKVQR